MKKHLITLFVFTTLLAFYSVTAFAQNYSGFKPIQDFHRHNGYDPVFKYAPVNTGDTLAWIRFRGRVTGASDTWYTGSNIMSWITGPVTANSFPANLVFRTGDRMRMTIRDNGNVGVNTFLPDQLFTVSHPNLPVIRFDRSDSNERDFEIFAGNEGNLFFRGGSDGTGPGLLNRMVITHAGLVGIGTDAPAFNLHTVGNTHTTGDFFGRIHFDDNGSHDAAPNTYINEAYFELHQRAGFVNQPASTTTDGGLFTLAPGGSSNDHQLYFADDGIFHRRRSGGAPNWIGAPWYKLISEEDINGTPNRIAKFTDPHQLGDSQLWDDGINVGIGTTTPTAKLHVIGDALVSANLQVDGSARIGNIQPSTNTGSHALAVGGSIICEEVKVALEANWPDYVFDPSYNPMLLSEVESYIQSNQRLPGIPSAEKIAEEGLAVGQMQVMMMEKIEELTLYVIRQQKELDELKADKEALKNLITSLKKETSQH